MQYVLFDDTSYYDLWPLTFTRPVSDLRVGIDKLSEKWARFLGQDVKTMAYSYLAPRYSTLDPTRESFCINAKFLPNAEFVRSVIEACPPDGYLVNAKKEVVAFRCKPAALGEFDGLVTLELVEKAELKAVECPEHDRP